MDQRSRAFRYWSIAASTALACGPRAVAPPERVSVLPARPNRPRPELTASSDVAPDPAPSSARVYFERRVARGGGSDELWVVSTELGIGWRLDAALRRDARCAVQRTERPADTDPDAHWDLQISCDPSKPRLGVQFENHELRLDNPSMSSVPDGARLRQVAAQVTAVHPDTTLHGQNPVAPCPDVKGPRIEVAIEVERTSFEGEPRTRFSLRSSQLALDAEWALVPSADGCKLATVSPDRNELRCAYGTIHSVRRNAGVLEVDEGLGGGLQLPCGASLAWIVRRSQP